MGQVIPAMGLVAFVAITGLWPQALVPAAVALALVLGSAFVLARLFLDLGVPRRWQTVLVAAWVLNPWFVRSFLASSSVPLDLLFVFGFAVVVLGVLWNQWRAVSVGLVVCAVGGQGAVAVLGVLWPIFVWRARRGDAFTPDAIALAVASALAIAILVLNPWHGAALPEFAPRALLGLAAALAILVALLVRSPQSARGVFWLPVLLAVAAIAQPMLAGASAIGIGVVAAAGVLAREIRIDLSPAAAWTMMIALALGSLHHEWSWPGRWLAGDQFTALFAVAAATAGLAAYMGLRRKAPSVAG